MFIEILEYIGIIALVLTALASYNQYKAGKFNKDYVEVEDSNKKQSRFQKWWQQSYLREVYVVRAGQRKGLCFIPWLGFWVSLFAVVVFVVWFTVSTVNPEPTLEKLTQYNGIMKEFYYHKKSDDVFKFELENGEIKYFYAHMWKKDINPQKDWIDKNTSIWVYEEWELFGKDYETSFWIQIDNQLLDKEAYEKQYNKRVSFANNHFPRLIISLKWLLGFLALLWFINRNPIETTNKINKKD